MEVSAEPAAAPVAAPAEASPSAPTEATKMAAENPVQYMEIFEKVIKTLPEHEKEIFIKAQLGELKNLCLFFCFFLLYHQQKNW
jgi:DNA-directed RNA polymerase specialized sigma24 family protein